MRDEVVFGEVHAYHYAPSTTPPRYSLLIAHGIGGHGGTYDRFCGSMVTRGVEIWSMDLPGHGLARGARGDFRFTDWLVDIGVAAKEIKTLSPAPLFVLGSSQGSAAAVHALAVAPELDGAITMGIILPEIPRAATGSERMGGPMQTPEAAQIAATEGDWRRIDLHTALDWSKDYAREDPAVLEKKLADPLRAWSYGYASYHSYWNYRPAHPITENAKPVLVTVGGADPLMPTDYVRACVERIGGPVELYVMPDAGHQLMTYYTDAYVQVVDEWSGRRAEALGFEAPPT